MQRKRESGTDEVAKENEKPREKQKSSIKGTFMKPFYMALKLP